MQFIDFFVPLIILEAVADEERIELYLNSQ